MSRPASARIESVARRLAAANGDPENWRAYQAAMLGNLKEQGKLRLDARGNPIVQLGQTLEVGDLSGLSTDQMRSLNKAGGAFTAYNTAKTEAYEERQMQLAAERQQQQLQREASAEMARETNRAQALGQSMATNVAAASGALPASCNMRDASAVVLDRQKQQAEAEYRARLESSPQMRASPSVAQMDAYAQTRMNLEKAILLPQLAVVSAPVSLEHLAIGALAGGGVNYGFQSMLNPKVDWLDVGVASITGGLTFGKGLMPSVAINSAGAFTNSSIRGEDPTRRVGSAVAGTLLGGSVGDAVGKFTRNAAVAAAIKYEAPEISSGLANAILPSNAISSGVTSEVTDILFPKGK